MRRLVQQEDYALRLVRDAGLPSATPFGFVELTPEREYLLVTEFFDGAVELAEADVDDALIDEGLRVIRQLWDAGLAHRDIKPANLMVRDGRLLLIDVAFTEVRPSPWRQAVDLANMMLCLALRSSAQRVYERARLQFTVEEISEGFAAARGLALPSQLRRALRTEGHGLHAEFLGLLPERPRPIKVQQWTPRRMVLWLGLLAVVVLLGLNYAEVFGDSEANRTPIDVAHLGCAASEEPEALWLEAQSVQTASAVPCVAFQGDAGASRVAAGVAGIGALVGAVTLFALILRSPRFAYRVGEAAGRAMTRPRRLLHRPPASGWGDAVAKSRGRMIGLVRHSWIRLTVASLVGHLALYLVLLVTLRDVGVSQGEVGGWRSSPCSPSSGC